MRSFVSNMLSFYFISFILWFNPNINFQNRQAVHPVPVQLRPKRLKNHLQNQNREKVKWKEKISVVT